MLAKRLREIRKEKNIRQEEVANYLGVKRQTYSAYERSVSVPDSWTLKSLADYFEVSIEEFFLDPTDETQETQEKQIMMLARRTRQIPSQQRDKLIKNFEENIDLYLEAMGLSEEKSS